jgi:pimeloyl-ACP methyl ester carboxylesterase
VTTLRSISLALAGAAVLAITACGEDAPDGAVGEEASAASAAAPTERPTGHVDELVDVGTGRLHLRCDGVGSVTVLLVAGWGASTASWATVDRSLADSARVCSYDRFGTGTSDAPATTQTFGTQASDLAALLRSAGEPGPYVVVGHSFGGAEAVTFAARQPNELVGLVLLDATPPTWPAAACAVPDDGTDMAGSFRTLCAAMHDPTQNPERLDVVAAFEEVTQIDALGALPMTVVTAAERSFPGLAGSELARLDAVWDAGVSEWAALSTSSTVVEVDSGHDIQLELPALVVREVLALLR